MKYKLRGKRILNLKEFVQRVREIWNSLTVRYEEKLVENFFQNELTFTGISRQHGVQTVRSFLRKCVKMSRVVEATTIYGYERIFFMVPRDWFEACIITRGRKPVLRSAISRWTAPLRYSRH